jgi:hypothetical protein
MKDIANPISRYEKDLGLQIGFRTFQHHDTGSSITFSVSDWIKGNNFDNLDICATQCSQDDVFSCLEGSILFHLLNCNDNDGQSIINELTEYTEDVLESEESDEDSSEECDRS